MATANTPAKKKTTSTPGKTLGVDLNARTVTHYVSTPTVDEQNEVLLPRGADISRFSKTRTVFDVHNYGSKDVVGKNLDYKIADDGHIAATRFAERPPTLPSTVEWMPDTLLHLFNTGDISGWSIGFNPIEYRDPTTKDLNAFGPCSLVHTRYRVLEYSVAPLPCNEDALTLSLQRRGILSKRLADSLRQFKRLPKLADVRRFQKTVVLLNPNPSAPPAKKTITVVIPPRSVSVAPIVDPERVAKRTVAIITGQLYE